MFVFSTGRRLYFVTDVPLRGGSCSIVEVDLVHLLDRLRRLVMDLATRKDVPHAYLF